VGEHILISRRVSKNEPSNPAKKQGLTEGDASLHSSLWNQAGMRNAYEQRWNNKTESREWTCHADIKQSPFVLEVGFDSDESAQRSRNGNGNRDEVWRRAADAIVTAGEKVAEFVGQQDSQKRDRERQPIQQDRWMGCGESSGRRETSIGPHVKKARKGHAEQSCQE
jgi:hypothetical protein